MARSKKKTPIFNLASDKNSGQPGIRPVTNKMQRFNLVVPWFKARKVFFPIELQHSQPVTEAINDLYEKGIVTEADLQENEKFFTTLVHASNTAIRNHEEEKLNALRNAVLNSALPGAPSDTMQRAILHVQSHIGLYQSFSVGVQSEHRF